MRGLLVMLMTVGGTTWSFDEDQVGKGPIGFEFATTRNAPAGKWIVQDDGGKQVLAQYAPTEVRDQIHESLDPEPAPPGPRFVPVPATRFAGTGTKLLWARTQLDKDSTNRRFAMAVVKESSYKDVRLSVRGKPISGEVDQTVGLVWRYQDADNYYVARSNVLEKNVRLYRVVKGNRIKFAGEEEVDLKLGEWRTLKIEHQGTTIRVFLNDRMLFESQDKTFPDAGKVGLWTKADSVSFFDDLTAEEMK